MVIKLFRWFMYFILAVIFLFALAIAWIRFAPSSLFGIIETSTGYRLEADKFSLTFLPFSINTKQLIVSDATKDNTRLLELDDGQASINLWRAARGETPFWSLSAKQTTLYLPGITEQPEAPPSKPAPFDIRPYLSFANIDISNLKIVQVGQNKSEAVLVSASIVRKDAGHYEIHLDYKSGEARLAVGSFLDYQRVGERTRLKLTSDALDLGSLISPPNTGEVTEGAAANGAEINHGNVPDKSNEPVARAQERVIDWGWLATLGKLDLDLAIGKLSLGRNEINNLDASLGFDPKEIRIDKLKGDVIAYVPGPSAKPVSQTARTDLAENKKTQSAGNPAVVKPVPTETIIRETILINGIFKPLGLSTLGADADGKFNLSTPKIKFGSTGRFNFNGLDQNNLKLDVTIEKLGSFAPLLPRELKQYTPLLLKTDLKMATNTYSINNMQLNFAKSDLAGDIYVNSATDILKIKADLKSKSLHYMKPEKTEKPSKAVMPEEKAAPTETTGSVSVSGRTAGTETSATSAVADSSATTKKETVAVGAADSRVAETDPGKTKGPKVFSDKPLDWRWLKIADIDVSIVAENLKINNIEFSNFTAVAKADQGKLWVFPLRATMGEGGFEADVSLDSREDGTELKGYLVVKNIDLGSLELIDTEEFQGGLTNVKIDITAAGASPQVLAASLDGKILFILQKATVKSGTIDLFASDILMEIFSKLNPFAKSDPMTELECALVDFNAEKGVLKTNQKLVLETSKMVIEGTGKIDLNDESIDIRINPTAKEGIGVNVGSLVKFIKLGGTLAQPAPVTDAAGLLQSTATIGLAASTGGISLVAERIVTKAITDQVVKKAINIVSGNACEQALKKLDPPVEQPLPEEKKQMPEQG